MTQDATYPHDQISEYWATYNPKRDPGKSYIEGARDDLRISVDAETVLSAAEYEAQWTDITSQFDPWVNGRYAFAALVWGLIFLCVFGLGAGP